MGTRPGAARVTSEHPWPAGRLPGDRARGKAGRKGGRESEVRRGEKATSAAQTARSSPLLGSVGLPAAPHLLLAA